MKVNEPGKGGTRVLPWGESPEPCQPWQHPGSPSMRQPSLPSVQPRRAPWLQWQKLQPLLSPVIQNTGHQHHDWPKSPPPHKT